MKAVERGAPAAAILAALCALACCLPFGIVGGLGLASVSVWIAPLRPWLLGAAPARFEFLANLSPGKSVRRSA